MLKLSPRHLPLIYLTSLSLAGMGLLWLLTSRYGAGVAGDSIHYLSVAQSLLNGHGFFDFSGGPLILFPPLYPLLLAGLAWLFRADVFTAAGLFNILLWGLNIFLSGLLLRRIFPLSPATFYLGAFFIFCSSSGLAMHASVLSDPLYLTFTLLFFLAGEDYLCQPDWGAFAALLCLAALSALLRFSGLSQVVGGALIVLLAHRQKLIKGLPLAAVFGALSLLPVALWIYLHNWLPYHTWWGTDNAAGANVPVNLLEALLKISYWFIPYRPILGSDYIQPLLELGAGLVLLLVINRLADWRAWAVELLRPVWLCLLVFTVVYFSSSILNIQTADHKVLFADRYFVIIMLPVLTLIFITFDKLLLPHLRLAPRVLKPALLLLFTLWLLYPLSKDYKYLRSSLTDGESGYNQYNTRFYHESVVLARAAALMAKEPDAWYYSNIPPAVWFYTRRAVQFPPVQDGARTRDEVKTYLAGWPNQKPGYYIWFEPDPFGLFMPLKDLFLSADMEMVEQMPDGSIVRVWERGTAK